MVAFISTSTSVKMAMLYQDNDLETLSRDQLINELKKLRAGIRKHRDSTGHELCWHHPDLWALLPEKIDADIAVPEWPQFMEGCIHYRRSLDEQKPKAPRIPEAPSK